MFVTDVKNVYINSTNRSAGTSNDFTITNIPPFENNPVTAKLVNACIPFTFYNIMAPGNTLTFIDSAATPHTVVIPPGNYTGATLATALALAMNGAGSPDTYTVTYDATTYLLTFNSTGNLTLDFTTTPNMAKQLGFISGNLYGPALIITGVQMVNLLVATEIFICSDLVNGSDNGVIPWIPSPTPSGTGGIFARVPLMACFGSIIVYNASTELPYYSVVQSTFSKLMDPNNNVLRTMRFYLTFPDGTPVALNGFDWSCEVLFNFNE